MNLDDYSLNEIKKLLVEKHKFKLTHHYSTPLELTFKHSCSSNSEILVYVIEGDVSITLYDHKDQRYLAEENFKLSFANFHSDFRKACDKIMVKYAETIIRQNLLNLKRLENLSNILLPKIDLK